MRSLLAPAELNAEQLQKHIVSTYQYLRILIAVLGAGLPLVLLVAGRAEGVAIQDSLSAYYYAEDWTRNWFVGSLFGSGALLIAYKGFTHLEDWLLNSAGVMCLGVALFPMTNPHDPGPPHFNPHNWFASAFFLLIALVCWFCADDTLPLLAKIKGQAIAKWLQRVYRFIAAGMVLAVAVVFVAGELNKDQKATVIEETVGIAFFAIYWAIKTWEMAQTEADLKAGLKQVGISNGEARFLPVPGAKP